MNPLFHPYVVTSYLTSIATLAIGLFVFQKNSRSPVHRSFLIFCGSIAQWSFFTALQAMTQDYEWAHFWAKFCHIGAMLIPVFFYYFTLKITGRVGKFPLAIGFCLAFLITILNFSTSLFIPGMRADVGVSHFTKAGSFYVLMILFFCVYVLLAIAHLWSEIRISNGARKKHLQYFFLASAVGFGIGIVNFFPVYGLTAWPYPYSAACGALYASVIAYAILRHKLFDIELAVKKGLVFAILFGIVYVTVSGLIFLAGYFLAKPPVPFLSGISIALAMLLYEPLKAALTRLTHSFLFQKQTTYTELIHRLTDRMAGAHDSQSLADEITGFLTREMGVEWAGLYLKDASSGLFHLRSSTLNTPVRELTESLQNGKLHAPFLRGQAADYCLSPEERRPFCESPELREEDIPVTLVKERKKPLILSPFDVESELSPEIKTRLRRDKVEAIVPILVEQNLYGILLLGKKKSDDMFTPEDEALLSTLKDEAGMSFLAAKLLKETTRSSLELGQRMKMAGVRKFSGGVHHEIRNPLHTVAHESDTILTHIDSGTYREASTESFTAEITTLCHIMIESLKRVEISLRRFSRFASPGREPEAVALSLGEELEKFLELMREGQKLDRIRIHNEVEKEVFVLANESALQEIFFNLFNNAYEAMGGSGELFLSAFAEGEYCELRIRDTGPGIKPEVLPHIFESYFTTKSDSEAVGIGLTIARNHTQNLGGTLEVSPPFAEHGAEFILKLHLCKMASAPQGTGPPA